MSVNWTKEQQQVITLRNRNILVAAAAGSGKTAVLVARILARVTNPLHPVDIDRLLIVTFTRAAAGEMRERIRMAMAEKLQENPQDEHLQRQMTLIHNAQITTIDSFCQYVIRSHYQVIGLDPGFRVADEGEIKLLKFDVGEQLLEQAYAAGDEAFVRFIEHFATGRGDAEILDMVLQIYQFSMSFPWPGDWLEMCKQSYRAKDLEQFCRQPWVKQLLRQTNRLLADMEREIQGALAVIAEPDGPYMYREALEADLQLIKKLSSASGYREYADRFGQLGKFTRLSAKKDAAVSERKRETVKEIRAGVKKSVENLQHQYFYADAEQMFADMRDCAPVMTVLLDLTKEFMEQFSGKKREKNILDFSDLEHLALEILIDRSGGEDHPSEAALELSAQYEEIMIDEYQDSNLVQEYVLTSISRCGRGTNNMFMVGDVKQSIYRFRLARPELFIEKYNAYTTADSDRQKIELHQNFRSRDQVLYGVNFIFSQIMAAYLGNVEYDDRSALYPGAAFPKGSTDFFDKTEVLLLDLQKDREAVAESGENARELEARLIGGRIREIVGRESVLDKLTGQWRPARYSDIVILLRTVSGWAERMAAILDKMGIPAHTGSRTGYFSAVEVQTVLSLLRLIDNPRQDIALTAVLLSPIGGFSQEELAMIRSTFADVPFEEACRYYAGITESTRLSRRLQRFYQQLESFRRRVPYTMMHELLWLILKETGYGDYAFAMPNGPQRRANLEMLIEKARAYEKTSYRGLFNFIRYIEQLQKYDVDFGEASILGEEENTVRILSIHKSKGLEYPIVFAAGLAKSFNQQDGRSRLAIHADLGIGCDWVEPQLRLKSPTLLKKVIQRQMTDENLGEELRVLYVVLTRAREKLILTGAVRDLEKKLEKWNAVSMQTEQKLSYTMLSGAACWLDWIMPALLRHPCSQPLRSQFRLPGQPNIRLSDQQAEYDIRVFNIDMLAGEEAVRQIEGQLQAETFLHWEASRVWDEKIKTSLQEKLQARYPYEHAGAIYGKISVTELKKKSQRLAEEEAQSLYHPPRMAPTLPKFRQETKVQSGAAKGTIYHRFLEALDFQRVMDRADLISQRKEMVQNNILTDAEAVVIELNRIGQFVHSPLGRRIRQAALADLLHREAQFMIEVPACDIQPAWTANDPVIIQGVIDAYFYEAGEIVLVDYKTDDTAPGQAELLREKYQMQLKIYQKALEQLTGIPVKEQYIYSFSLQKELPC